MRHIVHNLKYDRLIEDAEEILNTLGSKETEVSTKDGNSYSIEFAPLSDQEKFDRRGRDHLRPHH